jgi:nucleoside-diphosphate-sugar epimerase
VIVEKRTALVLGATGGIGGETARALARHGWHVRTLTRDLAKAEERAKAFGDAWTWVSGDAMNRVDVMSAAKGASVIVHAVNPAGYRNWGGLVLPMIDNSIAAARASGARILLPGTIYNYGPDAFPILQEDSPQNPTTKKGAIRVALEQHLAAASKEGVRSLVLRAGDFFGPRPGNSWFSQGMIKPGRPVRAITYPGSKGIGHSWAYLPDLAETFALLANREAELAPWVRLHFRGYWDEDGTGLTTAIRNAVGDSGVKVRAFPWAVLKVMSPFNETLRELIAMRGYWREDVRLDNSRLVALLGSEPHTPLEHAVMTSLKGLGALGPAIPA